ncbi:cell wall hydrolase/autolysin [Alkalidesulfovibrio alkalitolerans DSM 16529]|uniref:N-acetylmuramoyl-L-alanine amidase n=1 Tax=Alkalidesulfovibrio alkalitolerans DSM 16529 TaxID=1121439 RepID=S7UH60_9BACT|nr:N-acetylmuramoyl-L-alanine amidase [Alkalidesulfovibrio alkalitolerans]EPR31598.1 cell wall hydrolase/autolysin [Alkalidesulfovibrio alkalitolerans DSM 16529]
MQYDELKGLLSRDASIARMTRRAAVQLLAVSAVTAASLPWAMSALARESPQGLDPHTEAFRGQELLTRGRYAEAADVLAAAAATAPREEWIWLLAGRAQFFAGRFGEARESFRRVLRLNPADAQAQMMLERISMHPLPDDVQPQATVRGEANAGKAREEARAALAGRAMARVVIDPGHGGRDVGSSGPAGRYEKDAALALSLRAARRLKAVEPDLGVFLTRRADRFLTVAERVGAAERLSAGLFVSLHCDVSIEEPEVYIWGEAATSSPALRATARENAALRLETTALDRQGVGALFSRALRRRVQAVSAALAQILAQEIGAGGGHAGPFKILAQARVPSVLIIVPWMSREFEDIWAERLAAAVQRLRVLSGEAS